MVIQGRAVGDHWKANKGLHILYNNAGLISKVSEAIATENAENCRRWQPHCPLTPHLRRIQANIHTYYLQKLELLANILPLIMHVVCVVCRLMMRFMVPVAVTVRTPIACETGCLSIVQNFSWKVCWRRCAVSYYATSLMVFTVRQHSLLLCRALYWLQ